MKSYYMPSAVAEHDPHTKKVIELVLSFGGSADTDSTVTWLHENGLDDDPEDLFWQLDEFLKNAELSVKAEYGNVTITVSRKATPAGSTWWEKK